jgi:hypothetical protein
MGPGALVTTSAGLTCVGCAALQPELAGDGDPATSALIAIPASVAGGFSLRVTKPGAVFAAGRVGMLLGGSSRVVGLGYGYTLRTYLGGVMQEEAAAAVVEGEPMAMMATQPFDGIEVVIDATANTAGARFSVFEACSAVAAIAAEQPEPVQQPTRAAVIADLSAGNNPYHVVYRRPEWKKHPSKVIPGFPADAPALELTFGPDLVASLEADAQKWRDLERGVVHWIPGTNLLYVRTREVAEPLAAVVGTATPYSTGGHGTLTAGVIAEACQDCYLLIVSDPEGGFTYSLDYLARHAAWVDVAASTQQSFPFSGDAEAGAALSLASGPLSPYASAAKRWAEAGRLYFIAAGNTPAQDVAPDRMLPLWFTVVSGAYAECRGHELKSGKPNEFVSEYVVDAPAELTVDQYHSVSGTSFSTPLVATRFAQALKIVREQLKDTRKPGTYWSGTPQPSPFLADGKLTREELYQAFAQAAELFTTGEYTGPCGYLGVPVSATPWLEMGWGYVGPDQAVLAADLILGRRQAPAKPAEQKQHMDTYMGLREAAGSVTP